MPGTFASMAGVFLFFLLKGNYLTYIIFTLFLTALGFMICGEAEIYFNKKDPKYIVIDEVSAMLLALLFLPVYNLRVIVIAFLLFRVFDTLKPYPAGDIEEIKGSVGIMGDDLVAAFYTNIVLQASLRLAFFKAS